MLGFGCLGPLKQIEEVVEEVEEVVEIVEEVAEGVEKVSSELAENIPDNEMLKGTALAVEKLSKEVEKDAKLTMELMHKVLISSLSFNKFWFHGYTIFFFFQNTMFFLVESWVSNFYFFLG